MKNSLNISKRALKHLASAGAFSLAAVGSALAEVSPEVGAAVTQGKTDVQGTGAIILGVIVAVAAVAWIRRVVK